MSAPKQRPVASVDELVGHFHSGGKPEAAFRVGMEHEKILVRADGGAPDYGLIGSLLTRLRDSGWEGIEEHGQLIALEGGTRGNVTLEPGGQFEHSGAPWASVLDAVRDNDAHLDSLLPHLEALGLSMLGVGFRPFGSLDDVPWMPKGRYKVMRAYLPTRGQRGVEMMKRTATVQANVDFVDEADAMDQLRVSLGLSSLVTALFAASPLVDGRPSGYQSYRAAAWLDTDPDRCGLLPFAFEPGASFRHYAEWALDVPLFFVYRDGEYRPLPSRTTFRQFLVEGVGGERATMADWELHLSTLFPEVRLKRYLEVRQADASTRAMVAALPPLWRGILDDREARKAAWALVSDWSYEERLALYRDTPRAGLRARVRGKTLVELCAELVAVAKAGLGRVDATAQPLLAPLERIVDEKRSTADAVLDAFAAHDGDPRRLIAALRI